MNYKLYIGRVSGIKLFVHWTFFLLIGWIIYSDISSGLQLENILWSIGFVISIFGCVTLHELGHSLTAQRYHIRTRDITLLPIGGVASLESIPEKPKEELAVALAGPAVNVIIALILLPIIYWIQSPSSLQLANISSSNFLGSLLSVNVSLALFNMIPAFPMDGGRVLRALLAFKLDRAKATQIAARIGQVIAIIFMIVGFYGNTFLIFIGFFIFMGAQSELKYAQSYSALSGASIREAMPRDFPTIGADITIREAAEQLIGGQHKNFVVIHNTLPVGTLSSAEISKTLGEQGEAALVEQAMDKNILYLDSSLSLEQALKEFQLNKKSVAMITEQGVIIGAIDLNQIAQFLMVRNNRMKG